jgi:predicted RNA-binding protein with PUA-like domain
LIYTTALIDLLSAESAVVTEIPRYARDFREAALGMNKMFYLLKTEPTVYGFADLQKEQSTIWDGVTNPVAVKNLRGMSKGDKLVIYHTGDQKSAVGTATVESVDAADPKVPKIRIKAGKLISHPVSLAEIKTSELFEGSALVRQGRLSVVPLSKEQYEWLTGR